MEQDQGLLKKCPNCGKDILAQAIKCKHCKYNIGTDLEKEAQVNEDAYSYKKCPNCGKDILAQAIKCKHCKCNIGTDLEKEAQVNEDAYSYKKCPNWGKDILTQATICKYCKCNIDAGLKQKSIQNSIYDDSPSIVERISKEELYKFTVEFFKGVAPGGTQLGKKMIYHTSFVPNKKLSLVRKYYAKYDMDNEKIWLLYDNTLIGSCKTGFLLTDTYFYYSFKNQSNNGKVALDQIKKICLTGNQIILNGAIKLEIEPYMENQERIILKTYLDKISSGKTVISKKEIEELVVSQMNKKILTKIREFMIEDERIILVFWGLDSITARDFVVCTTHRLIFMLREWFGLGENMRDFEYDTITSITIKKEEGLLLSIADSALRLCILEIHAAGSVLSIKNLYRSDAEQVVKCAREYKNKLRYPKEINIVEKMSLPDELRELKDLFDSGILTEEEFQDAKKKVLGSTH